MVTGHPADGLTSRAVKLLTVRPRNGIPINDIHVPIVLGFAESAYFFLKKGRFRYSVVVSFLLRYYELCSNMNEFLQKYLLLLHVIRKRSTKLYFSKLPAPGLNVTDRTISPNISKKFFLLTL